MKLKNIMIIFIFLLVILTIGCVSASEDINQTNNIEHNSILSNIDDNNLEDCSQEDNLTITIGEPTTILKGEEDYINVQITSDKIIDGNLIAVVDGKEVYNQPAFYSDNIPFSDLTKNLGNKFGLYDITVGVYNDTFYKDYEQSWKFNYSYYNFDFPKVIYKGGEDYVYIDFSPDVSGKVTLYVDNKNISSDIMDYGRAYFSLYDVSLGNHTYKLKFDSSKNTAIYKSFQKSGLFNVDYLFGVNLFNDNIYLGDKTNLEICLPWDVRNNFTVSYNNKSKSYKVDDEGLYYLTLDDLEFGKNKITITYPKDSVYNYSKTKEVYVTVNEIFNVSSSVGYKSDDGIYLKMPKDAKGNLEVVVDGETKSYAIKNGEVNIPLSNYSMGLHTIYVNYTGSDYKIKGYNGTFGIVANFIYSDNIYYKDGFNVELSLPDDANGTFMVSHKNGYKRVNVVNGSARILFKNVIPFDDEEFLIEYVNGNYDDYKKAVLINCREESNNTQLSINMRSDLIYGESNSISVYMGSYAKGQLNVSVDGQFYGTFEVDDDGVVSISAEKLVENLKIGNHTIKFDYSGDDYFTPVTNTSYFNLDFYRLWPDNVVVEKDSSFFMVVSPNVEGRATLQIAGKTIEGELTYDDFEDGCEKYFTFDLTNVPYGNYNAKLIYSGDKYGNFTKEFNINVSYSVALDMEDQYNYGQSAQLHFVFSINPKANVTITVGEKKYVKYVNSQEVTLDVDNLTFSDNSVTVDFAGNNIYPSNSFNWTLNVIPQITFYETCNITEGQNVTLLLPDDAKGSLLVEIYDKGIMVNNITKQLENGFACINITQPKLGYYDIIAKYLGDDYQVDEIDSTFKVIPKIIYSKRVYVDQSSNLVFEMPKDANGRLVMKIAGKLFISNLEMGIANISIPVLEYLGDDVYYMQFSYTNDEKYGNFSDENNEFIDVVKYDLNITMTQPTELIANNYVTFTFKLPSDAKGAIYIDSYKGTVSNGKATVKVFLPYSGEKYIYYYYSGDSRYNDVEGDGFYVNVLPAPKLTMNTVSVYYTNKATFKVKVVDSYGKIASGKYVTFYVNGKKIKSIKTDKKGYATIKFTKTPGTYNVKASYKGGEVTKKLTVKHLVTLNTVKVKKSAKKLILKVTLKKGKTAIKFKKITFKFNGKKYTAKTNKKGVAKVTIKKSILKKLKVGKKITYQATYLKDTVKKTAKVIK